MTIEEARTFLDNLKVCIAEHPIVADWLVEIADRKTEPSGYKMKPIEQTEPQTEIKVEPTWVGTTYGRFEDEPQTDCSWK